MLFFTSSGHDHVLPQHHTGHTGRREEDELHGPRWEAHHGAMGEGGTHHQPRDQPLRGVCQGGGRWSHLHTAGKKWATFMERWTWLYHMSLVSFWAETYICRALKQCVIYTNFPRKSLCKTNFFFYEYRFFFSKMKRKSTIDNPLNVVANFVLFSVFSYLWPSW